MLKSSKIDEMLKSKTKCTLRPVSDTPRPIAIYATLNLLYFTIKFSQESFKNYFHSNELIKLNIMT